MNCGRKVTKKSTIFGLVRLMRRPLAKAPLRPPRAVRVGLELQRRAVPDRAPGEPEQIERAGDLHGLVGLGRGREQRGEAERGGEGMDDKPGVRARLRGEALRPAAAQRAREKERHVRARRRGEQEAGDEIGRRKRGAGKERRHGVRAAIAASTSARRGSGATAP